MPILVPDPSRAFPRALAPVAARTAALLAPGALHHPLDAFEVCVDGETLAIPVRVYYQPALVRLAAWAPGDAGLVALCLGTRHHDGFVREACLARLLDARRNWIVPFVVQLVGEYIPQIVRRIEAALPGLDHAAYGRFLLENPRFFARTERRVISYGYTYLAAGYPDKHDHPGTRTIAAFRRMRAAAAVSPDGAQARTT
ncbi:MAG TPA: hypothetical protein DCX52_15040 [Massilia sp.]|nr:hypothetical protein [Massilia sp.]